MNNKMTKNTDGEMRSSSATAKECCHISTLKTALLTPFDTGNIGTVAQAFATQTLIERLGYRNELIYFHYDAIQNPFLLSNLKKRGIKKYLGSIAGLLMRYPAKKGLWKFIDRHISLTEKVDNKKLKELSERYDFIVVGSDCVWNGDAFALETAYLLDFVKDSSHKGNFASSFACDYIPEDQKPVFQKYLSQFPMLSVREERGREIISELTGRDATVVLDPTLTCDMAFWDKIIAESKLDIREKYIFVAEYAISRPLMEDAERISLKYGLPIYCLYPPKGKRISAKTFVKAAPEDVLYLIRHAKYVLTDSYHMMIFSINFNKEFFAYRTVTNLPAISKYDSILGCLGLTGRLFHTEGEVHNMEDVTSYPPIDYEIVNQQLKQERERSMGYLKGLLEWADENAVRKR